MSTPRLPVFITTDDIAEIAGVGRSAVGNWRKRHADFPLPNASGRFDLEEVERWLIEKGKISGRASRRFVLWQLADAFSVLAHPRDALRFVVAGLVYLEACDRAQHQPRGEGGVSVARRLMWAAVREASDDELGTRLLEAAVEIERKNPAIKDLITPGFELGADASPSIIRIFLDTVEEEAKDDARFALFEEAVARTQETDRFRGEFSTPSDLTHLMTRLGAASGGTIFDPAAGEGGLLLMAALGDDRDDTQAMTLAGFERNAEVLNISRARFFLYGVPAKLVNVDAFRVPREELPAADLVLLDPPLGISEWGDADIYLDERWTYGVPPPKNADLAWLQLAVQSLTETGRAIVLTTAGALSRAGREAAIRSALLEAGCITAVVLLPPRLRPDTSVPLALWILRSPGTSADSVLLIDASQLGEAGRSLHVFDEADIDRIVRAVHDYAADPSKRANDSTIAWRVPITELDGGHLDPNRYRPTATVDLDELRQRRDELRASLEAAAGDAEDAVKAVLARLGRSR